MVPQTMVTLANLKIADELAWAERQRRVRLTKADPSPDAIRFDEPVQHLSFANRLRAAVSAILGTGDGRRPAAAS